MIIVLLAIGWGPLFIAEFVRGARPDLDASYGPQAFGMGWMGITLLCTILSVILAVIHAIRFVIRWLGGNGHEGLKP
jgi:hypothetical protein